MLGYLGKLVEDQMSKCLPDTFHTSLRNPRPRAELGGCWVGWWVGGVLYIIQPLWGSILQAKACQIFSWAEIQDGAKRGKNYMEGLWITKNLTISTAIVKRIYIHIWWVCKDSTAQVVTNPYLCSVVRNNVWLINHLEIENFIKTCF